MKKLIKIFTPSILLEWRKTIQLKKSKFDNKSVKEVFTEIYKTNHWNSTETFSGPGSEVESNKLLIKDLEELINNFGITSILDLACGDFNWMKEVNLTEIKYIGVDIVDDIIQKNNSQFSNSNRKFIVMDIINDKIPQSNLVIVRDCLVHLSNHDINKAIKNIKLSGSKYLLTTTFINEKKNFDLATGNWRPLNLQLEPFNFQNPIYLIKENLPLFDNNATHKYIGLWEISKLYKN